MSIEYEEELCRSGYEKVHDLRVEDAVSIVNSLLKELGYVVYKRRFPHSPLHNHIEYKLIKKDDIVPWNNE